MTYASDAARSADWHWLGEVWELTNEESDTFAGDDAYLMDVVRLTKSMCGVIKSEAIPGWAREPNPAFDNKPPTEVLLNRNEYHRLWDMVGRLERGEPS